MWTSLLLGAGALTLLLLPPSPVDPLDGSVQDHFCSRVAGRLASVSLEQCLRADLVDPGNGARSVGGIPLMQSEFLSGPEPRPAWLTSLLGWPQEPAPGKILLVGGCHGDELSSTSVVFQWITLLQQSGEASATAPGERSDLHWRIVPLLNPDGLLRRPARRMNENGVDLNRNFPTDSWFVESKQYWQSTGDDPRRYPGPYPLSEPESRWLAGQIDLFQPDVIVSVHAPYNNVDFDGPPAAPDHLGPLKLKLMGTFPGSLGRYAGISRQIPVVTIELPHAGIMPSPRDQRIIFEDLVGYLRGKIDGQRSLGSAP